MLRVAEGVDGMNISLVKAQLSDCEEIYDLQIKSFKTLLNKYNDYDYSHGAETIERTLQRFIETFTDYYIIVLNEYILGQHKYAIFKSCAN